MPDVFMVPGRPPRGDYDVNIKNGSVVIAPGSSLIGTVEVQGTTLSNGQVSVGTTVGGTIILAASAARLGVIITNQGSVDCYIGTGTVSTANGFLLKPGESVGIPTTSDVKGIVASSTTTIGYLAFA